MTNIHVGSRNNRFIAILILVLFSFCIVLVLFFPLIRQAPAALLITADPLKTADFAVALTGDLGDRVGDAAKLYKDNYVKGLIITFTDKQTMNMLVETAIVDGFPREDIIITEMKVKNTADEAKAVRELAKDQGVNSLIVITDPYHTLRTRIIFNKEFRNSGIQVQVRPVIDHWYRSDSWWQTKEGVNLTWEEYLKIGLFLFGLN